MIERRRYMGLTALPYDYEVEYLESRRGQYIETNIIPSGRDTIVKIKCMHPAWGGYYFTNNKEWPEYFRLENTYDTLYSIGRSTLRTPDNTTGVILHYELSNFQVKDLDSGEVILIGDEQTFVNTHPIQIFGAYALRIYYILFIENGVTLADFIPVVKDNIGYMYDKVSGQLFGNSGTGSFVIGPDKNSVTIMTQQQQYEMYG